MNDAIEQTHDDAPEMHFSAVTLSATGQRSRIDGRTHFGLALRAAMIVLGRHDRRGHQVNRHRQEYGWSIPSTVETCAGTRAFRAGLKFSSLQEA